MAEQLPMWGQGHCQIGDKNTADIKLQLICSDGAEYEGNPLYLHSTVLRKSEFYETMLSERWSSDKRPFEVEVTCSHSVDKYIKCFELMYSSQADESLCFSTVDEVLDILPVASELLFHVYIEECMQYLNAVRWNDAQEAQLRVMISSLQINTSPDLAARLGMNPCNSECMHLEMLEEFLPDMLSIISQGIEKHSTTVEKHIVDYFKAIASPAVVEKCKSALLKEFRANMDRVKSNYFEECEILDGYGWSALLWLVRLIQHCDGKLFKTVLEIFCEDSDFRNSIVDYLNYRLNYLHYLASIGMEVNQGGHPILDVWMNHFMKAMVNGDIITTTSFRHSFLTNWVDIIFRLISQNKGKDHMEEMAALEKGIADLAETLPLANQRCIYTIWKETFSRVSRYFGFHEISVYGDSRVTIKWAQGEYNINVIPLHQWCCRIKEAILFFKNISFEHIYRQHNSLADILSKSAHEGTEGYIRWEEYQENLLLDSDRVFLSCL